ncbi:MAG: hypothetical protein GY778_24210, partial [bacterium]|nr:hypothetical protein [bacterium]
MGTPTEASGRLVLAGTQASDTAVAIPAPTVHQARLRHPRRAASMWGQMMLNLPHSAWLLLDVTILVMGLCVGFLLFVYPANLPYPHVELWSACLVATMCLMVSSLVFGLYERETLLGYSRILTRMLLVTITAVVLTYAVIYVVMYTTLSRRVAGLAIGGYLVFGTFIRTLTWWSLQRVKRGLLVVGPGVLTDAFAQASADGFLPHYRVTGYVDDTSPPEARVADIARLGRTNEIPDICQQHGITDIVVGADAARNPEVMSWLLPCLRMGCRVTNEAVFYEKATGQILVNRITPHWFLFADLKVHSEEVATLKRAVDIAVSITGLLLTV